VAPDVGELSTMDATPRPELVRRKELTPLELVDSAIARIVRVHPTLTR
jgi:amidase